MAGGAQPISALSADISARMRLTGKDGQDWRRAFALLVVKKGKEAKNRRLLLNSQGFGASAVERDRRSFMLVVDLRGLRH